MMMFYLFLAFFKVASCAVNFVQIGDWGYMQDLSRVKAVMRGIKEY